VKTDLSVDTEIAPPFQVFAVGSVTPAAESRYGPGHSGVFETQGDQSAQVERGGAAMQPMLVVGHATVATLRLPRVSQAMERSTMGRCWQHSACQYESRASARAEC
jgi:hypothetical protein